MSNGKSYEERMQDNVRAISDAANALARNSCKQFAEMFAREHRTVQQNFTSLCVAWLEKLAKPDTYYDLRNEASVMLAREFVEKVQNRGLPYI